LSFLFLSTVAAVKMQYPFLFVTSAADQSHGHTPTWQMRLRLQSGGYPARASP
jgi:hypothetical protein